MYVIQVSRRHTFRVIAARDHAKHVMTPHPRRGDPACPATERREELIHGNDDAIIDEIRAALERDARLPHAAAVAVSERSGTVTLRGSLASIRQRRVAVQTAGALPGVRDVEDELGIDPRDRFIDDQIRGVALQALISDPAAPDERIDATVADAWLNLKGEVERQQESTAAFEAVSRVHGVGGVTNKITVISAGVDG